VDESKDAPHAVDKGRKVYVYERSGNTTDPIESAHVDRIQHLLRRRDRIEERREEIRSLSIGRTNRFAAPNLNPLAWISVIPLFPWRPLCKLSACYSFLTGIHHYAHVQRIQDGAIHVSDRPVPYSENSSESRETIVCEALGHYLHLVPLSSRRAPIRSAPRESYQLDTIQDCFRAMFDTARRFYEKSVSARPGLLSIRLGLKKMANSKIFRQYPDESKLFLYEEYQDEEILSFEDFLGHSNTFAVFRDRLIYSFDMATPPGL
jgi:hypothetical protein